MTTFDVLPLLLQRYLREAYGQPVSLSLLTGKSGAAVFRCTFTFATLILKQTISTAETAFYESAAARLRAHGIAVPDCFRVISDEVGVWLVLEDIPHPLPKPRWGVDTGRIDMLARLHRIPIPMDSVPFIPTYQPMWTGDMNARALDFLGESGNTALAGWLDASRAAAQPIFAGDCLISADPNPTNWGMRDDGTLVLFDWERFTRGTPPLDLAIALGGFGDRAQFEQAAAVYRSVRAKIDPSYRIENGLLARQIALAKLWSVIEYLSRGTPPDRADDLVLASLADGRFSAWVQQIVQGLSSG